MVRMVGNKIDTFSNICPSVVLYCEIESGRMRLRVRARCARCNGDLELNT